MKNSADLGGCYPPRPSASVDNTLLDLQNSSYPTRPHSIIANCPLIELVINESEEYWRTDKEFPSLQAQVKAQTQAIGMTQVRTKVDANTSTSKII